MSKLEITLKYDELISVMTRLAEALENRPREFQVTAEVSADVVEEEEKPLAPEKSEDIESPTINEKPVTLEQIRAVLTAKSQAGKKTAIQGLFKKYEADKLTAVDPARYTKLLKEAEAL